MRSLELARFDAHPCFQLHFSVSRLRVDLWALSAVARLDRTPARVNAPVSAVRRAAVRHPSCGEKEACRG
jgi:hypothetical protein